jgi:dTDP-4-dehydrorhamnose 3,5-epimerase-like enzyme
MKIQRIKLQSHGDERGSLIAIEENKDVPFAIKRVYYIFATKKEVRRGLHAHRNVRQLIVAVSGSTMVHLDDGFDKSEIRLDDPGQALLLEGVIWREMYDFSEDCVLMVLTDQLYDPTDYIRDYAAFCQLARGGH